MHPWIRIIKGGIAETKETDHLRMEEMELVRLMSVKTLKKRKNDREDKKMQEEKE